MTSRAATSARRTARPERPAPVDGAPALPAVPASLRALAYERFHQVVIGGRLRAGQFVSQRELVDLLGVPLGAVRELIPRLEAARLLLTVPKRGLQIAHIDLKLIRNAFQVRAMIEREAVQHFVRTASDGDIDDEIRRHRAILERARSSAPDPALDQDAQKVDWGLHDRMVDAIRNEILSEVYRANSLHVRMMRLDARSVRQQRVVPAMEEHLAFLALVRDRDLAGAVDAIQQHIERSRQRVLATVLEHGAA